MVFHNYVSFLTILIALTQTEGLVTFIDWVYQPLDTKDKPMTSYPNVVERSNVLFKILLDSNIQVIYDLNS